MNDHRYEGESMHAPQAPALTELEYRVLRLSATGLLTHEVADRLDMDLDEVRRHVTSVMAARGARSKLEAVVLALRAGLIDLD
jgi:DNA-binding CsgD family transcriptional regulator